MIRIRQRIAGCSILQSHQGSNLTSVHLVYLFALVGMQSNNSTNSLLFSLGDVVDIRTSFQSSGVNTDKGQLTDVRVALQLEGQGSKRRLVISRTILLFTSVSINTSHRLHIQRAWQEVNHSIKQ